MSEPVDWQARAEALEAALEALRKRLLALADVLPAEYLPYLQAEIDTLEGAPTDPLDGWDETTSLTASDVATEIALVWKRLEDA